MKLFSPFSDIFQPLCMNVVCPVGNTLPETIILSYNIYHETTSERHGESGCGEDVSTSS